MTRRIVKKPAEEGKHGWHPCVLDKGMESVYHGFEWKLGGSAVPSCSYGQVGDHLWVRETAEYLKYGALWNMSNNAEARVVYKTGDVEYYMLSEEDGAKFKTGKKSSIFMPRWASRITLEITDIRVERLKEISDEDAIKEGIERTKANSGLFYNYEEHKNLLGGIPPIDSFKSLWRSIHKNQHIWTSNPYVLVISFRRVK